MKFFKSIFAAFVFCVCVCAGAFAECASGEYIDPDNTESCLSCPSPYDTSDGATATRESDCYLTLNSGQYVATTGAAPSNCPAGSYCPGGGNIYYGQTGGAISCSTLSGGYTSSETGSTKPQDCFKTCSTVAHATGMSGNDYYGAGVDTCHVTGCEDGYGPNAGNTSCNPNTINLNWANGGHGTAPTTPSSCTYGRIFNMPSAMTATGYTFNKWKVNNKEFSAGASVSCNNTNLGVYSGSVTITGSWNANTYTIDYNSNKPSTASASVTGSTANSTHTYDVSKALTTNGYSLTGWAFSGWNTQANGTGSSYTDGQSVKNLTTTNGGTVALYAQWTANMYTVELNKNADDATAGTTPVTATYDYDMPTSITLPGRPGYVFVGYYDATTGGTQYYTADGASARTWNKITDTTLYARWRQCDAGFYCPGDNTKNACPTNYPNSAAGSTSVNDCYLTLTAGKYVKTANQGMQDCESGNYCPGYYLKETCDWNEENNSGHWPDSQVSCSKDATRTFSDIYYDKTGGIFPCEAGSVQPATGKTTCNACSIRYFQPATGQTECKVCSDGYTTEKEGSKSASDCKFIPKFCDNEGDSCFSFPTTITVKNKM